MTVVCVLWTVHTWIPGSILTVHATLQDTTREFMVTLLYTITLLLPHTHQRENYYGSGYNACILDITLLRDHNCHFWVIVLVINVPL